jgi:hypothetical protein
LESQQSCLLPVDDVGWLLEGTSYFCSIFSSLGLPCQSEPALPDETGAPCQAFAADPGAASGCTARMCAPGNRER